MVKILKITRYCHNNDKIVWLLFRSRIFLSSVVNGQSFFLHISTHLTACKCTSNLLIVSYFNKTCNSPSSAVTIQSPEQYGNFTGKFNYFPPPPRRPVESRWSTPYESTHSDCSRFYIVHLSNDGGKLGASKTEQFVNVKRELLFAYHRVFNKTMNKTVFVTVMRVLDK